MGYSNTAKNVSGFADNCSLNIRTRFKTHSGAVPPISRWNNAGFPVCTRLAPRINT